ncbi:hypothetical protein SEA_FAUST_138 [Streptomyces phage Faust]|uniref:Uncharacterized protein n=1 Tax=Streptomyces phage Faust TaxID=2767565 RepID=A0A7G9UYW6_9CAUD|nr:hypothetical protein PP456_gp138 [Streptomyces phage Faust]QNN99221.1 hypothetical protein SEA_FAUST_138 [Streptomyces phage Faust]
MGLFNNNRRGGYKKNQKVYIVAKGEYGRIEKFESGGLIKVRGFKSGEMFVRVGDIQPGD